MAVEELSLINRRPNIVKMVAPVIATTSTLSLDMYSNFDVDPTTPTATLSLVPSQSYVPKTKASGSSTSGYSLVNTTFINFDPDDFSGISDNGRFYVRLNRDGTRSRMHSIMPYSRLKNPIETISGTVNEVEIFIPFSRVSKSISLLNFQDDLRIKFNENDIGLFFEDGESFSEKVNVGGFFAVGPAGTTNIKGTVVLG